MEEKLIRWVPDINLNFSYYIDYILYDKDGVSITLNDGNNSSPKVMVIFDKFIASYKITHRKFEFNKDIFFDEQCNKKFERKWNFFKVLNSDYIKLLSRDSLGIIDSYGLVHFLIVVSELRIDIVASPEVKVEILLNNTVDSFKR